MWGHGDLRNLSTVWSLGGRAALVSAPCLWVPECGQESGQSSRHKTQVMFPLDAVRPSFPGVVVHLTGLQRAHRTEERGGQGEMVSWGGSQRQGTAQNYRPWSEPLTCEMGKG